VKFFYLGLWPAVLKSPAGIGSKPESWGLLGLDPQMCFAFPLSQYCLSIAIAIAG